MMETLSMMPRQDCFQFLYEHGFPDWFLTHAQSEYNWEWQKILVGLRNTQFFYPSNSYFGSGSIVGKHLSRSDAEQRGEWLIQRLAVVVATWPWPHGDAVANSLRLDGYEVDAQAFRLISLEGPVSAQEEEDRLDTLVRVSRIPNGATVRQHITDAHTLFVEGKYHPSLNESRNILQALVDDIGTETDRNGGHSAALPGGTVNRIRYLRDVGFLTPDEQAAFGSAWRALSAGSHPGVPEREEARIGLILAFEFGQLLLLKCENWSKNGYRKFSTPSVSGILSGLREHLASTSVQDGERPRKGLNFSAGDT